MAKSHSNGAVRANNPKTELWLHRATGQWAKTVRGRRYYFGADPQTAQERWYREKDDILAGGEAAKA